VHFNSTILTALLAISQGKGRCGGSPSRVSERHAGRCVLGCKTRDSPQQAGVVELAISMAEIAARWSDHVQHRKGGCTVGRRRVIVTGFVKTPGTQRPVNDVLFKVGDKGEGYINGFPPLVIFLMQENQIQYYSAIFSFRREIVSPKPWLVSGSFSTLFFFSLSASHCL
jgi:hypothetical protein